MRLFYNRLTHPTHMRQWLGWTCVPWFTRGERYTGPQRRF
ncbi:hypothetical protein RISK_005978 [Rhodopirellula islandica]|uniref:Uncharacterized protein n=1 Tax=Rhodopirellula islandica TaxID=595434 RepID=A0A0J1E8J7_RHOIS|nr:hypothetical protein RISK_005978 [Rhodopirellula islandica]